MLDLNPEILIESVGADFEYESLDDLLEKEWLLTNHRGGFSSGSITGCNTSRYHGLLTGSLNSPAGRVLALSNCFEQMNFQGSSSVLSCFEFEGSIFSGAVKYLRNWRKDVGVHFDYVVNGVKICKSIYLSKSSDKAAIVYKFSDVGDGFEFFVRPLTAMRDYHGLSKKSAGLSSAWAGKGVLVKNNNGPAGELFLRADGMLFDQEEEWWYRFLYRKDLERGQDCVEDVWSPGKFRCRVEKPMELVLWASFDSLHKKAVDEEFNLDDLLVELEGHEQEVIKDCPLTIPEAHDLCVGADDFLVERPLNRRKGWSLLSGYPWFMDWGREAFISLPGLLLCTGRYEKAQSVLVTFARYMNKGMIPNRFDDYQNIVHYNSIDASLWFINAAFEYYKFSGDDETMNKKLLPIINWIIDSYHDGTRYGIHADIDGLITGGEPGSQLTWMDAKTGGKAFTPRYGKAVEVNALWYNAICRAAEYYRDTNPEVAERFGFMAEEIGENFCELFWDRDSGSLYDCVYPDGRVDKSIRANQIFAVSLEFSALSGEQQFSVVSKVQQHLLTPYGLRTLSPEDANYEGIYKGDQYRRDMAYHQGTVWAFLMGHFVESYMKVRGYSKQSKREAEGLLRPLLNHMNSEACMGSVSEIFDGDYPHKPRGCFAHAAAVGELIRACYLVNK